MITLLGLIGAVAPVQAADPTAAEAQRLDAYWTGDRMRSATPRDLVLKDPPDGAGAVLAPASGSGSSPAAAPLAAPVDGANWNGGGIVLRRTGVIFFSIGSDDFSCSGSIIDDAGDPSYSLILTAGHCAYDLATGTFTTNWTFIPAFDDTPNAANCSETTYGCWDARALVVHQGWTNENGLTPAALQHDYAIAVVGPVRNGTKQLDSLGAYPLKLAGVSLGDTLSAFGYPAGLPYDGSQLVYCRDEAGVDSFVGSWALVCDMTGGASGGPWLAETGNAGTTAGCVASLSSYRLTDDDLHLFGPELGGGTAKVYEAARAATPDPSGIDHHVVTGSVAIAPFTDTCTSSFRADIEWMYFSAITTGCSPTTYCPTATVTREQMAGFLVRAFDLPSTTTDYFNDDESSTLENEINALRKSGITTGCSIGKYCPKGEVTREQMASFLVRALDLPPTTTDYFVDDNGRTSEDDINSLRKAGITTGCDATHYCPTATVTREQMAGFLHRALGD